MCKALELVPNAVCSLHSNVRSITMTRSIVLLSLRLICKCCNNNPTSAYHSVTGTCKLILRWVGPFKVLACVGNSIPFGAAS